MVTLNLYIITAKKVSIYGYASILVKAETLEEAQIKAEQFDEKYHEAWPYLTYDLSGDNLGNIDDLDCIYLSYIE
jgi:hypothetical protein